MSNLNPDDFEEILDEIKHKTGPIVDFGEIRAIESNFNTKGMKFKRKDTQGIEGMIVVGEDKEKVAIDISVDDGNVRSFILRDKHDSDRLQNVIGWLRDKYDGR